MKLTPHQERIVDEIIAGRVFDIPSYLEVFSLGRYQQYRPDDILKNFESCESGQKYLFKKYSGLFYTEVYDQSGVYLTRHPIANKFTHDLNENPISTPVSAEVEMRICPDIVEHNGVKFSINFLEHSYYVADDFNDIKEFILLWSYLKRESLILEVDKSYEVKDFTSFYELTTQELHPEDNPTWKTVYDTIPASHEGDLDKLIVSFVPQKNAQGYIAKAWKINAEHFTTCNDFIGKKILSTPSLELFQQEKYCTFEEVSQKKNSFVAWVAVLISVISVLIGNILPLIGKQESDYLNEISERVYALELTIKADTTSQNIIDELIEIKKEISFISEHLNADQSAEAITNLASQIEKLSILLSEPDDTDTPTE